MFLFPEIIKSFKSAYDVDPKSHYVKDFIRNVWFEYHPYPFEKHPDWDELEGIIGKINSPFLKQETPTAISLSEFKIRLIDNFIYDKKTGICFCQFAFGHHQLFLEHLARFVKKIPYYDEVGDRDKLRDSYIKDGYGIMKSSVSLNQIVVSKNFEYTPEEWNVFSLYNRFEI